MTKSTLTTNKLSSTETLHFCGDGYRDYTYNLDGIKAASRDNQIQLLSSMFGNHGMYEIFLGSLDVLYDYLAEERSEELKDGDIVHDKANMNMSDLIKHLKTR